MRYDSTTTNAPVFFDNRWVGRTGIGRFASEISERLAVRSLNLAGRPLDWSDPYRLGAAVSNCRKDGGILFSPGFNAPLIPGNNFVFCVMDLNHIDIEENSSLTKRFYYNALIKRSIKHIPYTVTISEFSRRRIIEWADVHPDKVINVGCGVSRCFSGRAQPIEKLGQYFLCVSNRKLHKNEERLIFAFSRADLSDDVRLVFTGYSTARLRSLAADLGITKRIVFWGGADEATMGRLYAGALALVVPSVYEGFGLPALEAMASGTSVIAANNTALPELIGDAGIMVDPYSTTEIANAIEQLWQDSGLRQDLGRKGELKSMKYSWDKVASEVSNVLNKVSQYLGLHP